MKRFLFLFFAFAILSGTVSKKAHSQKLPNKWVIGLWDQSWGYNNIPNSMVLDLKTLNAGTIPSLQKYQLNLTTRNWWYNGVALGDSAGLLQFYSHAGLSLQDTNELIPHWIHDSLILNNDLLIKRPENDTIYHWFFIANHYYLSNHFGLYETILAVKGDSVWIKKPAKLLFRIGPYYQFNNHYGFNSFFHGYMVQANENCDGTKFWIWYFDLFKRKFATFQLSSTGTDTTRFWQRLDPRIDYVLDIKTSPRGDIIMASVDLSDSIIGYTNPVQQTGPIFDSSIMNYSLIDLNRSNGMLSLHQNFDSATYQNGLNVGDWGSFFEFSQTGKHVYTNKALTSIHLKSYWGQQIIRYKIKNSFVQSSDTIFTNLSSKYFTRDIARTPEGRMIFGGYTLNNNWHSYYLGILVDPERPYPVFHPQKIINTHYYNGPPRNNWTSFPRFSAGFTPESFIVSEGYCFGDSTRFWLRDTMCLDSVKWNFGDPASGSANLSTLMHPTHVFSAADTFFVQLYRFYPFRADTIQKRIILHLPDTVRASNDTLLCAGDTIGLHTNLSYPFFHSWSNGSTDSNIVVTDSGWYHVTVVGECNVSKDSVYVTYASTPVVDLGNDTILCKDTLVLAATWPLASYLWSTSDSTDSIQTLQSGLYRVTATNICGADSDTIQVRIHPQAQPNIPDTSVCAGKSIRISIPFDYTSYIWSNWTASNYILINSPGKYWVQTQNLCGTFSDTFFVAPSPGPQVELGNDTLICKNSPLLLNGFHQHNDGYFWRHNASSDSVVSVNSTNLYHLVVSNGCGTASDSVFVSAIDPPLVTLGADTAICLSDSILLAVTGTHDSSSYQWSPLGSNAPNYWAKDTGLYHVLVTNQCGADSSQQRVLDLPKPSSNFVKDTILCDNASWPLSASNPKAFYLWSTGSLDSSISINQQGSYWVTITNPCGVLVDSTRVGYLYSPTVKLTSDQTKALCLGTPIEILATATGGALSFLWANGDTSDKMVVTQPGPYSIKVSNLCGNASDQIDPVYVNLKADFVLNKTQGEAPLVIKPSNQSVGATSSRWFLDSTLISLEQQSTSNVKIIAYGKHALMLVTANGSCTDTTFQEIEVLENTNLPPRLCDFDIRPNPSSGEFFLTALNTDKQVREIKIFDKLGALVFEADVSDWKENPFFWPAPQSQLQLAAGTYTIGLFCEEETVYHRLVID